jgi:hypothetical protein
MNDDELSDQVRALRAEGRSPKEIARLLDLRPAVVAPLIRAIAAQDEARTAEPGIAGCWISPGWSDGLTVPADAAWPDPETGEQGPSGLVGVFLAREAPDRKVWACGWLVDVYCLGVKDVIEPLLIDDHALPRKTRQFFAAFGGQSMRAPVELARQIVYGAVDYARGLGFEPAPGFAESADHLGPWDGPSVISFGRDGKPLYIQGPHDDAGTIMKTLETTVGRGNFDFIVEMTN